MTEYTVKIPLEDDVAEALKFYAADNHKSLELIIRIAVKTTMQNLVRASFDLVANKKAVKYSHTGSVEVGFAVEIPEDEERENDGD